MRLLKEIRNLMDNYQVRSGIYHYFRREYRPAVDFLRKALRETDGLSAAEQRHAEHYLTLSLMDLAERHAQDGELEEGVAELRQAAEISPGFADIHFRLGGLLEALDRTDEALAAYDAAIASNPGYLMARVAQGFCLLRRGDVKRASKVLEQALLTKKRLMTRPFRKGLERLEKGQIDEATEFFHDTFLASPQLGEEYRRKALESLKTEDYDKALEEFERAAALNPRYPDLHNFRGIVLFELDRIGEAISAFRLSVNLSPRYPVPRLNLAFALAHAGELEEAEEILQQILETDPSEPSAAAKLEEIRGGRAESRRRPVNRSGNR